MEKQTNLMKIKLEAEELKLKAFADMVNLADDESDDSQNTPITQEDLDEQLNKMAEWCYSCIRASVDYTHSRIDNAIGQINDYMESHANGHMPSMDMSQIKAILATCKIDNQFEEYKAPIQSKKHAVYASLADIKIDVK